ncbi:helix-turn-helix domain-containing protein, partial [Paraburkholderia sp.]|uniref:MarR family transcriptional regulator n=1 Tax=Paraburkholderia sp. TaxID=1926495 RepID=UPI00286F771C
MSSGQYSDFLTFRLDLTSALLSERANAVYRERWGLDVRALRVLRIVCAEPGVTPKAVSQRALIEKTLLSKTLAELESRGGGGRLSDTSRDTQTTQPRRHARKRTGNPKAHAHP